jgi:uncharacterized protein
MLYDLSRLRGDLDRIDRRYEPDAFASTDDDFRLIGPATLIAEVRKDARKVRLAGRVAATLECNCSRCVELFTVPVNAAFDEMFLPFDANAAGRSEEVREDDMAVAFYKDDVIDLGELMREQFYLALPMKPLCRDDCKGLCPICGINRNRETCSCRSEWVDPRLDVLRNIARKS